MKVLYGAVRILFCGTALFSQDHADNLEKRADELNEALSKVRDSHDPSTDAFLGQALNGVGPFLIIGGGVGYTGVGIGAMALPSRAPRNLDAYTYSLAMSSPTSFAR